MKVNSKRAKNPFQNREKNIQDILKFVQKKDPLSSSRTKLSITPRFGTSNYLNYKESSKEKFSPRVWDSRLRTQRNESPDLFTSNYSKSLKAVTRVPPLRELNYSYFKNYHENSYSKRQNLIKNSNFQEKSCKFKAGLGDRLKKKIMVQEDLVDSTLFSKPAVTYADKLFKLNQICSLQHT